jgi:hypothetical protein
MKACSQYEEELADRAAMGLAPESHLVAHLESCAECRDALDELRNVAAVNTRVAAGLPEPSKSVSLASAFLSSLEGKENSSSFPFPKTILVVSAVAAFVAILITIWVPQRRSEQGIASVDAPKTEAIWEPTWQRLRAEVGTDTLPAGRGGSSVAAHYRVKDAYSELN